MATYLSPDEMRRRGYSSETIADGEVIENGINEASSLIILIEESFKDIPRPRVTLHVARGYDDEWVLSEERVAELSSLDKEQRWQDVSDDSIENFQEYFSFSDAEGWLFYLPAFMRHYLKNFPSCGYDAIYWPCVSKEHVDLLDSRQMKCIDQFVDFCHKYSEYL